MKGTLKFVVAALMLSEQVGGADAPETDNPHLWKSRVTSVAVFKNGLGFFMREGQVALREGWCVASEVPPAAFGTLAVFAHGKEEIVDSVGSGPGEVVEFDGTDAPKDLPAKRARLEASKNLNVQLTYAHKGSDRSSAGKLISVGADFVRVVRAGVGFTLVLRKVIFEAEALTAWIRTLPDERQHALKARFHAVLTTLANSGLLARIDPALMSAGDKSFTRVAVDYLRERVACPFLEDELCSIHTFMFDTSSA